MLYWVRNDLRVHDNPALTMAYRQGCRDAIFLGCKKQWNQHHLSPIKQDFIYRHLIVLATKLADLGVRFHFVEVEDFSGQQHWLMNWQDERRQQQQSAEVFANNEVELNEQQRDQHLIARGLTLSLFEADVIVPKGQVVTAAGEMYRVFTPFKRAWIKAVMHHSFECLANPEADQATQNKVDNQQAIEQLQACRNNLDKSSSDWPDAKMVMSEQLGDWLEDNVLDYGKQRDFPAKAATSKLSPCLSIGAISPRLLMRLLLQRHPMVMEQPESSAFCWLNELIWREFYRHLLHAYPNLIKGENFNRQYDAIAWRNDPEEFSRWCQGKTGYPLVDAAMRQLNQTGWMHNRLRMVVASFLTKDLLIDWRWGEQYFMEQLIDGDFAANNGGWQWAASTGCDAQPYFRIFNPITQSQKFDPNGEFIRKYVPELADIPERHIHFPHQYLIDKSCENLYESAMVDHKHARERTLAAYKACR
ncbi:deoxyribodipyrimidine photo-lyase [Thalassotalea mangrovi]|uniref:Deoxyribodipyrimidine photo-lyase n=1 Tax=Thalassotalea mangrovi TaxID=2572245 RepID=A0A4U1BBR8_9GAMM|nr:deoxyribodipyrimidine photo-lyase [Thalassotalea mangrovi]TKB47469.1 deoxyribodipyrimidine photo-lyase [Thalassotalea mangrovi]